MIIHEKKNVKIYPGFSQTKYEAKNYCPRYIESKQHKRSQNNERVKRSSHLEST